MAKKSRLNLALDDVSDEILTTLLQKTQASSRTVVIERALKLYHLVQEETSQGGDLVIRRPNQPDKTVIFLY